MNFIISFIIRASGLGLSFLLTVLVSRNYAKGDVGTYFLFVQLITLLAMFLRYGSDNALLKFSQYFSINDRIRALKITLKLALPIYFVIVIITIVFSKLFVQVDVLFLGLLILSIVPYAFTQFVGEYLKGIGFQNFGIFIQALLIPILMLFLIQVQSDELEKLYTISIFVCGFMAIICWQKTIKPKAYNDGYVLVEYKSVLKSFFYVSVLNVIIATMDSIMIGLLHSANAVAEYNIASKIALISSVLLVVINGLIGPVFAALWNENKLDKLNETFIKIASIMAVISIFVFLFFVVYGEWLLTNLFGSDYQSSYNLLIILAFAQSVVLCTGPVAYLLMMTENTAIHRRSLNLAVSCNIILNLLLIPIWGALGASIATATSLVIKNIYSFTMANRKFGFLRNWIRK